jgi:hypothetical protein
MRRLRQALHPSSQFMTGAFLPRLQARLPNLSLMAVRTVSTGKYDRFVTPTPG